MASVPLFPTLPRVLRGLRGAGCRLGVLSSNAEGNIRACLRAHQVEELFEAVVGYVGDEVRDIEAARKAAVTWGFNTRDLLARHRPDHLVERPDQLLGLLG